TIHDVFSLCGRNYWKQWGSQSDVPKINVLLAPFFEKLLIKLKHNYIHTVSEATKDDLVKFGAKKPIFVIHNSIDAGLANHHEETNPLQFVYVGRLVFYKNLEVVIKAISIAKKTEPKIKLILVGSGPHTKPLEELTNSLGLESNIEFKGYVGADEKAKIIATSSALVFPSLCEGFGLVILEAFAQNKPVLVSDMRPMSDIVSHGKNGYVLNPSDENLWAEHLLKIIKNPQEASLMGKEGNHLLFSSFSQELMYQKVMQMYVLCKNSIMK
ncbi:MAG: glycosyltransferase, partial [Nitrosopumilaceae archaeon]